MLFRKQKKYIFETLKKMDLMDDVIPPPTMEETEKACLELVTFLDDNQSKVRQSKLLFKTMAYKLIVGCVFVDGYLMYYRNWM